MKHVQLPPAIDLELLGTCNLQCPFCYGPRHDRRVTSIPHLLTAIQRFPDYGVQRIIITGGEPLLIRELPLILQTAQAVGLKTVLSTNGLGLKKKMDDILPWVNWLALPIDGDTPQSHQQMRVGHRRHFEEMLELLGLLRHHAAPVQIKLGTVVSALNRSHIVGIATLVGDTPPDVWKLYQVAYSNYAADHQAQLEISDDEFAEIYQEAQRAARQVGIRTTAYTRATRDGKHLFLTPSGEAMIIWEGQEKIIGHFYEDLDGVAASWEKYISTSRLADNVAATYPEADVVELASLA